MSEQAWSDEVLEPMREFCDPLADETVGMLFEGEQVGAANELMRHLVQNEQAVPEQMPPGLRLYFEQSGQLPPWADLELVAEGEALFCRNGPQVIVGLNCASLPWCYAFAKGVQVLHLTARLATDPYRRILETSQMVIDVMTPGGLAPGGYGLRSTQKVRLMHAAVRHLIRRSGQWSPAWGQPINQEDMASTLLSFSSLILQSMERMGCDFTDRERLAYYHAWRVVGFVLGVDERLMPEDPDEGDALMLALQRRHHHPSPEGQLMTSALVQMMQHLTPGNVFDGLPVAFIRHLLGDETADLLAVPSASWDRILVSPLRMLGWVLDEEIDQGGPRHARLASLLGRRFLDGLVWVNRGPERLPFRIPTTMRTAWNVQGWERA